MFKSALFTIASAATITTSVSDAFDNVRANAQNVADVYAVAGQILDVDYTDYASRASAEANLYHAASRLDGVAAYAQSGQIPNI